MDRNVVIIIGLVFFCTGLVTPAASSLYEWNAELGEGGPGIALSDIQDQAIGIDGELYLLSEGGGFVTHWTSNGSYLGIWRDTGLFISRISFDRTSGTVYALCDSRDSSGGRVVKLTRDLSPVATWGHAIANPPTLLYPYDIFNPVDIAVAPNGHVYVLDNDGFRVSVYDAYGNYWSGWGSDLPRRPAYPGVNNWHGAIAVDQARNVYVATMGGSDPYAGSFPSTIVKYDLFGVQQAIFETYPAGSAGTVVYDLAADAGGTVYAVTFSAAPVYQSAVLQYSSSGAFSKVVFGKTDAGMGQGSIATVDTDGAGGVYVNLLRKDRPADPVQAYCLLKVTPDGMIEDEWVYRDLLGPDGTLVSPRDAVELPNGEILVVDGGRNDVQRFSATGDFLGRFCGGYGTGPGRFDGPAGIAVARVNPRFFGPWIVYVVDQRNRRVQYFRSDGRYLGSWNVSSDPWGIASDGATDVYVTAPPIVMKFTATGESITNWDGFGSFIEGIGPRGVTVSTAENPEGLVYVADTLDNLVDVRSRNGASVRVIGGTYGSGAGEVNQPYDVAVDLAGRVLVVDTGNDRIDAFMPDGRFIESWGGYGRLNGQFNEPVGAMVSGDGTLYVADLGNHRVQVFRPTEPSLPPVPGGAGVPYDTDGDGLYDDVNGNDRADFADVVLFFNQMTWIAENEPIEAFDYNGNGRIDFADVVWLFNNL